MLAWGLKIIEKSKPLLNYPFKGEWKSDMHMISVNGEDLEDLTVKVWANLDNPFLSYGFLKF